MAEKGSPVVKRSREGHLGPGKSDNLSGAQLIVSRCFPELGGGAQSPIKDTIIRNCVLVLSRTGTHEPLQKPTKPSMRGTHVTHAHAGSTS